MTAAPPPALPTAQPLEDLSRREQLASLLRLRPDSAWALARFSLDAIMLVAAALASSLGSRAAGVDAPHAGWLVLFAILVVTAFAGRGMYRPRLRHEILEDLRGVVVAKEIGRASCRERVYSNV